LLLGGLFVWAAAVHFVTFKDVSSMLAGRGFPAPAFLLAAGSVVELAGGLCLILGVGRPYAAAALAIFTIAATVMMLDFWPSSRSGATRMCVPCGAVSGSRPLTPPPPSRPNPPPGGGAPPPRARRSAIRSASASFLPLSAL